MSKTVTPPQPMGSVEEVAAFFGVPTATVYQWNYRGTGPRAYRIGRYLRYRWDEVEAWATSRVVDHGEVA